MLSPKTRDVLAAIPLLTAANIATISILLFIFLVLFSPLTIGNQTHLAHDDFTRGPGTFELDVVAAACGETEGPERH